jgi:bifunctional enzyme Fae/Hps
MILNRKQKYLQIAFNRSLYEVEEMLRDLPANEHIIVEVGTPLVKENGEQGIRAIVNKWRSIIGDKAYVVADMKCMDRGSTEVQLASSAGAKAITCLGLAPTETVNDFISNCHKFGIDSMVDMLNVKFPFEVLSKLRKQPDIVVLHRAADETLLEMPYHDINRIKGAYNSVISVAGGEGVKDITRAFFNGADIAVAWRSFNESPEQVKILAEQFLNSIKGYAKSKQRAI